MTNGFQKSYQTVTGKKVKALEMESPNAQTMQTIETNEINIIIQLSQVELI